MGRVFLAERVFPIINHPMWPRKGRHEGSKALGLATHDRRSRRPHA